MIRIALIGTGAIGKRYIEAISKLGCDYELICHDKNIGELNNIKKFRLDNKIKNLKYNIFIKDKDFYKWINEKTIVIVATTAKDRKKILLECIKRSPLSIIAEKPLVQTFSDYEIIEKEAKNYKVNIQINFIAHMQPFWKRIYEEIKDINLSMSTNLPKKWGIACVGLHHIELFTWFTREKEFEIIGSTLDDIYEQKRRGYYDISGKILLESKKGNTLSINSSGNSKISTIQLINSKKYYNYFEIQEKLIEIDIINNIEINSAKHVYVSDYMTQVIQKTNDNKNSKLLPNIFESKIAHELLFKFLDHHGEKELNFT